MKSRLAPQTRRILQAVILNEWSDEARKAALESRRSKSKGMPSWLKTSGKVGLVVGGALLGGYLGIRGAAGRANAGRLLKAGEDLTGKLLTRPGEKARLSKGLGLTGFMKKSLRSKSKVIRKIAKAAKKTDDTLAIPIPHYGAGVGKEVSHITAGDAPHTLSKEAFSKGKVIRVLADSKADSTKVADRLRKAGGKWNQGSMLCEGKNCEMYAREITQGKSISKLLRQAKIAGGTGAVIGAIPGASTFRRKKNPTQNEWSDEARKAALETRRRKALSRVKKGGYARYSPEESSKLEKPWIVKWEHENLPTDITGDIKKFEDRLIKQTRKFGTKSLSFASSMGRKVGLTQTIEYISGSKGVHSSWVDKSTGYRYDFHPEKGISLKSILGRVTGKLTETAPNGTKRELRGPQYNLFKRNCQMAPKFLPKYIEKFNKIRGMERKLDDMSSKGSPISNQVYNLIQVINGGPGSGFHGHKGIPGQQGGSLPEGESAPSASRAMIVRPQVALTESPQAHARRQKQNFTKTAKFAEIYSGYIKALEEKGPKKDDLPRLAQLHDLAAKHFEDSANQSLMVKGSTKEEQIARLVKADYHKQQANKLYSKLGRKSNAKGFTKGLGKAFLYGLIGGSPEEVAQQIAFKTARAGIDIAKEGIRGGVRKVGEDITMKKALAQIEHDRAQGLHGGAKNLVEGKARDMARIKAKDLLSSFGRGSQEAATERATAKKDRYLSGKEARRAEDIETSARFGKELEAEAAKIREQAKQGGRRAPLMEPREVRKRPRSQFVVSEDPTFNFEIPVANLTGQVRKETLHDREYLVAPLTMIVPGVLAGSKGPLLYPEEEVSKNPSAWNGMPIVVNHPTKEGIPVEARSPGILEEYQIGTVFNTKYNGKLVAEGWFDVDRTRKTNIGIYESLVHNKPIELSTGLYTDNEAFQGTWNGRPYEFVARNYRPDHLAILLGSRGACSIKDGCGVLINKQVQYFKNIRNEAVSPEIRNLILGIEVRQTLNFSLNPVEYSPFGRARRFAKKKTTEFLGGEKGFKGAKTGFKGGLGGAVIGGTAGTAVAPGVGTLVGGAVGAAVGSRMGISRAHKKFGAVGGRGAEMGALAGSIAAPIGKASLAFAPKKLAQGAGLGAKISRGASHTVQFGKQAGVGTGAYMGADVGMSQLSKKKKFAKFTSNAWTEEARRKSAETRRRRKQAQQPQEDQQDSRLGKVLGGALAFGAGAGAAESVRKSLPEGKSVGTLARAVKRSFKDVPKYAIHPVTQMPMEVKAGLGRKVLRLLSRIRR